MSLWLTDLVSTSSMIEVLPSVSITSKYWCTRLTCCKTEFDREELVAQGGRRQRRRCEGKNPSCGLPRHADLASLSLPP